MFNEIASHYDFTMLPWGKNVEQKVTSKDKFKVLQDPIHNFMIMLNAMMQSFLKITVEYQNNFQMTFLSKTHTFFGDFYVKKYSEV